MNPESNLPILHEKMSLRLQEMARQTRGAFGFKAVDLFSGQEFSYNENHAFPQASAIKIPILMEVFLQSHAGKFSLTDVRRIEKKDKTPGSGILGELGDGTVEMNLRDLCILMIVVSDNTATNLLIDLVGMQNVNQMLQKLGLKKTVLRRRMMDLEAVAKNEENLSTPAEAAHIMQHLYQGTFVNRAVCDGILDILKKPKTTSISSALPAGTVIASKPGSIPGVVTEWAVVYLKNRPYILTVMENFGVEPEGAGAIKEISKVVHEYFSRLDRASLHGTYLPRDNPKTS